MLLESQRNEVREKLRQLDFDSRRVQFTPLSEYPNNLKKIFPGVKWLLTQKKPPPTCEVCWDKTTGYLFVFGDPAFNDQRKGFFAPDTNYISADYRVKSWDELSKYIERWTKALAAEATLETSGNKVQYWERARNLLLLEQISHCHQA